jgi:hypothetical protein
MVRRIVPEVAVLVLSLAPTADAGMISNFSFETVPGATSGEGLLPTGWVQVAIPAPYNTPDTWSNDGSYGLPPSYVGNFTGVTAPDGIRWVAGGAFGRLQGANPSGESFGTTVALTPGAQYQLDVSLHQALRSDINNPGGYDVFLANANTFSDVLTATLLGSLAPTTSFGDSWVLRTLIFTAPADSASRPFLFFSPYGLRASNFLGDPVTYPGLDAANLNLASANVPEPGSLALWGLSAIAGAAWTSRCRRRSLSLARSPDRAG